MQDSSGLHFGPESRDARETGDKIDHPTSSHCQSYRVQMYPFVTYGLINFLLWRRRSGFYTFPSCKKIPFIIVFNLPGPSLKWVWLRPAGQSQWRGRASRSSCIRRQMDLLVTFKKRSQVEEKEQQKIREFFEKCI